MALTGAATVASQREVSEKLLETLYRLEKTKDTEITRLSSELDSLRDELIRRVHAKARSELSLQVSESRRKGDEGISFLGAAPGNILYASPAYATLWGRPPGTLPPDAPARLAARLPAAR